MACKTLLSVAAMMVLFVVGCANFQKGESIVKWTQGEPVRMSEAPMDGTYALYSGTDLRNSQIQYPLKKGDKLGFVQRDGRTIAVAGSNEEPVVPGSLTKSYFWRKIR